MDEIEEMPKLDPPGSGISAFEMLYLRLLVRPYILTFVDFKKAKQSYQKSSSLFFDEIANVKKELVEERMLIKRPLFVEDSSRFWSVAMLCRHLAKVNNGISSFVSKGFEATQTELPPTSERLKSIKPEVEKNHSSEIEKLISSSKALEDTFSKIPEEELSNRRMHHPWLGNISHLQWYWFSGFHFRIHLKQLLRIKKQIKKRKSA